MVFGQRDFQINISKSVIFIGDKPYQIRSWPYPSISHETVLKQVQFRVPKIECHESGEDLPYPDWEEETKTQMTTWMTCKVTVLAGLSLKTIFEAFIF